MSISIGVLALQGDFWEHGQCLERCGAGVQWVRTPDDLERVSGLILPGGESTCMKRLMGQESLDTAIQQWAQQGGVLWGTCAGAILLAEKVDDQPGVLKQLSIHMQRNAYGRQQESFTGPVRTEQGVCEGVFIRAPRIQSMGASVHVLGRCQHAGSEDIVAVSQGRVLATTFHPECAFDDWHGLMMALCQQPMASWKTIMRRAA